MATLALTAVGTAIGGPIGGAIGGLLGRTLDGQIFGTGSRQGPRLEELAVSTSSYGSPIPQQFGTMRSTGSIIWATDLVESSETSGGKGQPSVTTYNYTTSFAVALSSRPIQRIGRIWANGNLLRGEDGDLKAPGLIRIHHGYGDQAPDPLISAAEGAYAPAFRGTAYVVFEDLALADFGNRIPALSFEVIADTEQLTVADIVTSAAPDSQVSADLSGIQGFTNSGGSLNKVLDVLDTAKPLTVDSGAKELSIRTVPLLEEEAVKLPPALASISDEGVINLGGNALRRIERHKAEPVAVRYYDVERDYQLGLQRPTGRMTLIPEATLDLPAAITPNEARRIASAISLRQASSRVRLQWNLAEIDNRIGPGQLVTVPGINGKWLVTSWEWRETGVELELTPLRAELNQTFSGEAGQPSKPKDVLLPQTTLRAFELPWDGTGSANEMRIYAAASSINENWTGAALFNDVDNELVPIAAAAKTQPVSGQLILPKHPGQALILDRSAALEVELDSPHMQFPPSSIEAVANGQARLLVGHEILQYTHAIQIDAQVWRLEGLLRGRGGTEPQTNLVHHAGTLVTLLDGSLTRLPGNLAGNANGSSIVAIGRGDDNPVNATVENRGASLRPMVPVHPRTTVQEDGSILACWTRRARGAWDWLDGVDVPLVEESERYCVGVGQTNQPNRLWTSTVSRILLTPEMLGPFPGQAIWVQQIGRNAKSYPLFLMTAPQP